MKLFYLVGSIVLTALILILAFENITASCTGMYFFFYEVKSNPTLVTLGITAIGILTGVFYHAFFVKTMDNSPEEEETENF